MTMICRNVFNPKHRCQSVSEWKFSIANAVQVPFVRLAESVALGNPEKWAVLSMPSAKFQPVAAVTVWRVQGLIYDHILAMPEVSAGKQDSLSSLICNSSCRRHHWSYKSSSHLISFMFIGSILITICTVYAQYIFGKLHSKMPLISDDYQLCSNGVDSCKGCDSIVARPDQQSLVIVFNGITRTDLTCRSASVSTASSYC